MSSAEARATSKLADRYRVLLDISRTLSGTLGSQELYRAIYHETAGVLEASGFYVALYDQARDMATVLFYADRGEERSVSVSYRGSDSEVIRTGKATLVSDRAAASSLLVLGDEGGEVTRSAISAPMLHKGRVLGVLSAQSYRADAYSPEDLELLQSIADIAAVATENARFVSEVERRRREAEQIEEIGRALTSSLDTEEVLGKITAAVLRVMEVDGSAVWLLDGTVGHVAMSAGEVQVPEGAEWDARGAVYDRLAEGRSLVVEDLAESPLVPGHIREYMSGGSGLAVPLAVEGELIGALSAGSRQVRAFNDEDVRVLRRIASQASVALVNARLHQTLQALSVTDPLTGLPNRRALEQHLRREVAAARRGRDLVLVIFDLDEFKRYNDSAGHIAGDRALKAFSDILGSENRAMNLVARYGGDEFVSVLSDSGAEGAREYVRRIAYLVENEPVLAENGLTASAGIARWDGATMGSMEDLIAEADRELYREKARKAG